MVTNDVQEAHPGSTNGPAEAELICVSVSRSKMAEANGGRTRF